MNASDSKIKMLKEDNDDLIEELKHKSRSLEESEQLVKRLKREKNEWQELYLQVAPGKRPAEAGRSDPLTTRGLGRTKEVTRQGNHLPWRRRLVVSGRDVKEKNERKCD